MTDGGRKLVPFYRDSFLVSFAVLCLRFSSCLSPSPRSQGMNCVFLKPFSNSFVSLSF